MKEYKRTNLEELSKEWHETIYKYRSWTNEYDRKTITNRELYFASPIQFGDKKDCKLPIRYDLLTKEQRIYFIGIQNIRIGKLISREMVMEDFEKNPISSDSIILKYQKKISKKTDNRLGVLSLTFNPDNNEMWDKYADGNKGFCIGYDTKELFKYFGAIGGGCIDYYSVLPTVYPEPIMYIDEQLDKIIFSKEEKWKFENEYRVYKLEFPVLKKEERIKKVPARLFKEIIVGKNMSDDMLKNFKASLPEELKNIPMIKR